MKKYFPAALLVIVMAALLAGAAAAQEEKGGPAPESVRKEIKIITPATAAVGDEQLLCTPETSAPGDGKRLYKETVIMPLTLSLIPIIFWVAVAVVVILAIIMAHRNTRLRYDVIQLAIKEGRELPPDIFRNGYRRRRRDPLLAGLVLTALGLALGVALGATAGWTQAVWGLIPLFIGIAFLIYVPFYRKQKKENGEQ